MFLCSFVSIVFAAMTHAQLTAPAVTCPAVFTSLAVKTVQCSNNGVVVDCSQAMPTGTRVKVTCNPGYNAGSRKVKTAKCTRDGSWTNAEVTCKQVSVTYDGDGHGQALVHRGNVTQPSQVPWHAGIWAPNGPIYEQWCGGTLIAPNLVLTAAHCFWDLKLRRVLPNLHTYKVALGKVYRDWALDTSNPHIQRMDVLRVILDSRFDGYVRRNLENDIALVELTSNATMTDYVQPAAIDWTEGQPANGSVGVVAGWGYTEDEERSQVLRSIELPYIDHDACYQSLRGDKFKKLLTSDKFCAGFINQAKSVCQGDSGGGFVVKDNITNIPYVRGVVSIDFRPGGYRTDICYALFYTGFTNVGVQRYLTWIRQHVLEAPAVPCPAVTTSAAVSGVICDLDRVHVNCSQPMTTGVVATFTCSVGLQARNLTYKVATCLRDGNWSNTEVNCEEDVTLDHRKRDCGRQGNTVTALIGGEQVTDGELPWNINIYHMWGGIGWNYWCAGTLITATHVITTADCVGDIDNSLIPATEFQLAARKLLEDYTTAEPSAQWRNLSAIIRHELFVYDSDRAHDIALLVVSSGFELNNFVMPACIDWLGRLPAPTASDVLITAAVKKGSNDTTVWLMAAQGHFIRLDRASCNTSVKSDRRKYLTDDRFCAQTVSDETCHDRAAAGLMFRHTTPAGSRHYLWGVRSQWLAYTWSGKCVTNRLTSYTNITQYIPWIKLHSGVV